MQLMETQMKLLAENDVLERALNAVLADPEELLWDEAFGPEAQEQERHAYALSLSNLSNAAFAEAMALYDGRL